MGMKCAVLLAAIAFQAEADNARLARTVLARFTDNMNLMTDFSFTYQGEGQLHLPANPTPKQVEDAEKSPKTYQGVYAFRVADGAAALDIYERYVNLEMPLHLHRNTYAVVGSEMERLEQTPDMDKKIAVPDKVPGDAATLNRPSSPQFFVLFWRLRAAARDPIGWGFRVTGWEEVDGHLCVVAEMNLSFGETFPSKPTLKFWIDLERGALPLKTEVRRDGMMFLRASDIGLEKFTLPGGKAVWFPVRGTEHTFSFKKGEDPSSPFFREDSAIVKGSLRFNQGLTDADFSIRPGGRIFTVSKSLESDRRFEEARQAHGRAVAKTPRDAEGVRKALESRLAEANAQSKELEASSAAEEGFGTGTTQLVVAAAATVLIVVGVFLKWRAR